MKLLIAAHTPPPYHGQSFIVKQLVEGLAGETRSGVSIECLHLNLRFSDDVEDIGRGIGRKALLLVKYLLQLIWIKIRHRPDAIYYVPAPGKRVAVYRDWLLLGAAKLLGVPVVFHWLAGGLADWVQNVARPWERFLSHAAYKGAALSIVPVSSELPCAEYFSPRSVIVLPTGIPDPCQDFETRVLPERLKRLARRTEAFAGKKPSDFRVIFMAHCSEDKGLFDAIESTRILAEQLISDGHALSVSLQVYGKFIDEKEKQRFESLLASSSTTGFPITIHHTPFVSGKEKDAAFCNADVLCFPTYYAAEVIPTVIMDAMAYGLPVVTTSWRGIPEILPPGGLSPIPIQNPEKVADRLREALSFDAFPIYRDQYQQHFTTQKFLIAMREAIEKEMR